MNTGISLNDIFKAAMQVEVIGEGYYRRYAERSDSEQIRKTFVLLADKEQTHYKKFKELLTALSPAEAGKGIAKENRSKISKMINQVIFDRTSNVDNLLSKVKNLHEALQSALGLEHKSIEFYELIMPEVSEEARRAIKLIIAEEEQHAQIIRNLIENQA
jgi:rubrerythrin